jgi:hypothetical protein
MGKKLEVRAQEFNLNPQNLGEFKEFLSNVPNHAKYTIDTRENGTFFNTYWIGVNENEEEEPTETYKVVLPHICVYGKYAHDLITEMNPIEGIPFLLDATDTIDLSRGFVQILVRNIAMNHPPYIVVKGWVKEHRAFLDDAAYKYRIPLQDSDDNRFL